jgi:hypothetical protein
MFGFLFEPEETGDTLLRNAVSLHTTTPKVVFLHTYVMRRDNQRAY